MIYLGTLGRMIGIKCPASLQASQSNQPRLRATLEGRVLAQVPYTGDRRVWSAQTSAATSFNDQATLQDFASGLWGLGPFWFLPPDALVGNCLSPEVVDLKRLPTFTGYDNVTLGVPVSTPDGVAPVSMHNNDLALPGFFTLDHTPVIGGQSVVASAYVAGVGARVRVYFYDASGAQVSMGESTVQSSGAMIRSWVKWTVPATAVSCRVATFNATVSARPALTFTDDLMDWTSGRGCPSAIVHGVQESLTRATNQRGGQMSSLSYTITEVG